jgi:hypothetical protein
MNDYIIYHIYFSLQDLIRDLDETKDGHPSEHAEQHARQPPLALLPGPGTLA